MTAEQKAHWKQPRRLQKMRSRRKSWRTLDFLSRPRRQNWRKVHLIGWTYTLSIDAMWCMLSHPLDIDDKKILLTSSTDIITMVLLKSLSLEKSKKIRLYHKSIFSSVSPQIPPTFFSFFPKFHFKKFPKKKIFLFSLSANTPLLIPSISFLSDSLQSFLLKMEPFWPYRPEI